MIKQYQEMPVLLRRLRDNPTFAKKVFLAADKDEVNATSGRLVPMTVDQTEEKQEN